MNMLLRILLNGKEAIANEKYMAYNIECSPELNLAAAGVEGREHVYVGGYLSGS